MYSNIYEILFDIEAIWNACITYNGVDADSELVNSRALIICLLLPVPIDWNVDKKSMLLSMTVGIRMGNYA